MKVAIVHELLTMRGGAERVAKVFADMFPDAPIYTLLYDEKKLGDWFPKERVRTSSIQKSTAFWPLPSGNFNHHLYLRRFPAAVEAWDFSEFDLVVSSSSAFAHGIITNGAPKHLCYVHSPARYLWDRTHDVQEQAAKGVLGFFKKSYLQRTFHKLRLWDAEAADRPDALLAASKEVQRRIELYWRRESEVVHPPIDSLWIENSDQRSAIGHTERLSPVTDRYFVVVSTLARYKRIDLAIAAANELKFPLKIVGEGPDEHRLKHLAGSTVEFLGYKDRDELKKIYANAKATIIPGEEDFGLVSVESIACGTPVIAYKKGGVLETMNDKTALFFDEPTSASLANVMKNFDRSRFDPEKLHSQAAGFSRKRFEERVLEQIEKMRKL